MVFSGFPFLQRKEHKQETVHMDTDKTAIDCPDNVPEETSEDIQLMRGSCRSERRSKSLTHFEGAYTPEWQWYFHQGRVLWKTKRCEIDVEER